jgi:SSS family solute:Na+ symporter
MALLIIGLTGAFALLLGVLARGGRKMDLEQWSVGGRGFGAVLVFLLMAGEIYTTFTFLGGSGFAYGKGGPVLYILCYGAVAYTLSYWLLPVIWAYGKRHGLISQPDFFARKYDSPALGLLVSVVGIVALIPYLVLQLKGLGIIVAIASDGAIGSDLAVCIGAALVAVYVVVSGVHGSAWTAVVKDTAILAIALFLGIYLPLHYYGGFGAMFHAIDAAKPGFLTLPARGQSAAWFDSTVLLTAIGFYMWPHSFASLYTAKRAEVFRQNAIVMPLYQLVLLFVFFVGFAAVLQVPGLTGTQIDLALFKLSIASFDPWFVGVIGAAGVLTALVPGSMILLTASTLLANNIYRGVLHRRADQAQIGRVARLMVPVVALVGVGFTLRGGDTIVALLLMGYSFVTQLFPALIASLLRRNPLTPAGAFAGICAGVATVAATSLGGWHIADALPGAPDWVADLNIGMVALVLNVAVAAIVSLLSPAVSTRPATG